MPCVDGVLASTGDVQTCEETCDGECCVGPGVCDEFTIRVCRDSASCSGEGACSDVSIYNVFLGYEGTEACYYAGNKGKGAWASCVTRGGRVWQGDTRGIVDKLETVLADGVELGVGTDDGAGLAEGLADEPVERR